MERDSGPWGEARPAKPPLWPWIAVLLAAAAAWGVFYAPPKATPYVRAIQAGEADHAANRVYNEARDQRDDQ